MRNLCEQRLQTLYLKCYERCIYLEITHRLNEYFYAEVLIENVVYFRMQLDSLQNPGADIGMEVPSMLQYKYHADKEVFIPDFNHNISEIGSKREKKMTGGIT